MSTARPAGWAGGWAAGWAGGCGVCCACAADTDASKPSPINSNKVLMGFMLSSRLPGILNLIGCSDPNNFIQITLFIDFTRDLGEKDERDSSSYLRRGAL